MDKDFNLFPGKNLSDLFKDIYDNQLNKKTRISELIHEMRNMVKHKGDIAVIGPIIKDLVETSVKNDEVLIKLATIAQRLMIAESKNEGDEGFLTAAEREQLLQDIEQLEDQVDTSDIDKSKKKLSKK